MSSPTPPSASSAPEANPLAGGCPVGRDKSSSTAAPPAGCPMAAAGAGASASAGRSEPPASSSLHSAAPAGAAHPFTYAKASQFAEAGLPASGEIVPPNSIPAAGRGNSDDGRSWLNPSANQLFRALARKDKAIEAGDATAVAAVHVAVTDNTWAEIMEYEKLHEKTCPTPTLARFNGMDGIYSFKAKMMMRMWGLRPFDRHDWYVNRCGKEVKYVIDYYSFENSDPASGDTSVDYFIDARPAPTFGGMVDRARMAFGKWRRGEKIW